MGSGSSIEKRHDVPVTPRRQTQPQEGLNFQRTPQAVQTAHEPFGVTVTGKLLGHSDGPTRTTSITITPPPPEPSHLLTREEMSRLGPPIPERTRVEFGKLHCWPTLSGNLKFSATLSGAGLQR